MFQLQEQGAEAWEEEEVTATERKRRRKLGRRRLRKLAEFLRTRVPRKRFDMGFFGDEGFAENKCGTSACALGWATVCFPRSGLRMKSVVEEDSILSFEGKTYLDAAETFFSLGPCDTNFLFGGLDEMTPKQKAKQIEKFLEDDVR